MHLVIRNYEGSSKLIDELIDRRKDVEEIIKGVEGFVSYHLVKTPDGGASVSVYQSKAGVDESTKRAAAYIKENLEGVAAGPPQVIQGQTVIDF